MKSRGMFITFEGPEKSGKSTHARLLEKYLRGRGYATLFVREPGSTRTGERIRRILLDKKAQGMSVFCEMLLYMAARAQLADEAIRPALEKGVVVLCDRFLDSTIAYQGYGCGLDIAVIKEIGSRIVGDLTPDLTLLLDFCESTHRLRRTSSRDRIEMRPDAFHRRVREGYRRLSREEKGRIKIVSVLSDKSQTQDSIRKIVDICLSRKSSVTRPRSRRSSALLFRSA